MQFSELIAPIEGSTFLAETRGRTPIHVSDRSVDLSDVMSWPILTDLLNMTGIWSAASLQLGLDTKPIPPEAYCISVTGRDGTAVRQPQADKIKQFLRQGASLVVNDIDSLTPGLRTLATSIERSLGGKVQANLYCSWADHQAFDSHFDTHEVYALHIEGEKRWRVYEGRLEWPIAHPSFKTLDQEFHHRNRGAIAFEPTLRPGDLLYLPRGQYHDALAASAGSIHIAFGVTYPIGFDVAQLLQDFVIRDSLFRADLPMITGDADGAELRARAAQLGDRLAEMARDPEFLSGLAQFRSGFHYRRGGFDLPGDAQQRYRPRSGLRVQDEGGKAILVGPNGRAPIPDGLAEMVTWVLGQTVCTEAELSAAFPERTPPDIKRFLADMMSMRVLDSG